MDNIQPSEIQTSEEERIQVVYSRRPRNNHYSWENPRHCLASLDRTWNVLDMLRRHKDRPPLCEMKILEIGCGGGTWLRDFIQWGVRPENLTGIDIRPDCIAAAKQLCPPAVQLFQGNAACLSLPDSCMDMVLQSTVFSSILDFEIRRQTAKEMLRVLKPRGIILWSDFFVNNPWNPDVRGVKKHEIKSLFPDCDVKLRRVCLAPPIGRVVARWSSALYRLLDMLPFLQTHYLGIIQRSK